MLHYELQDWEPKYAGVFTNPLFRSDYYCYQTYEFLLDYHRENGSCCISINDFENKTGNKAQYIRNYISDLHFARLLELTIISGDVILKLPGEQHLPKTTMQLDCISEETIAFHSAVQEVFCLKARTAAKKLKFKKWKRRLDFFCFYQLLVESNLGLYRYERIKDFNLETQIEEYFLWYDHQAQLINQLMDFNIDKKGLVLNFEQL